MADSECLNGMKVETSSLKWFELRHWPNVTRDVVFIHRPDSCTTGFLEEFDGSAIDLAGSEVWEGMEVDNVKPQVDRFVFPDVHRVTVLASSRLLHLGGASGHPPFVVLFVTHLVKLVTCSSCR